MIADGVHPCLCNRDKVVNAERRRCREGLVGILRPELELSRSFKAQESHLLPFLRCSWFGYVNALEYLIDNVAEDAHEIRLGFEDQSSPWKAQDITPVSLVGLPIHQLSVPGPVHDHILGRVLDNKSSSGPTGP